MLVAAAVAWCVGMLPSTLYDTSSTWPVGAAIVLGLPFALVLLTSTGVAQWYELRRHVARAGGWVAATALAWGAGLTAFGLITTPLWRPGQGTPLVLTTGLALRRLLREPDASSPRRHPQHPTSRTAYGSPTGLG